MILEPFITKQYETVSLHQKMADAVLLFKSRLFLVVIDEESKPFSIISYYDFLVNPNGLVKDCKLDKPRLDYKIDVIHALKLMASSCNYVLPVYQGNTLAGAVTQYDLINEVISQYSSHELLTQELTLKFKASIAEILGLISHLEPDTCEREKNEIKDMIGSTCKKSIQFLNRRINL